MQYMKFITLSAVDVPGIIDAAVDGGSVAAVVGASVAGVSTVILVVSVTVVVPIALCYMLKSKGEYCMSVLIVSLSQNSYNIANFHQFAILRIVCACTN